MREQTRKRPWLAALLGAIYPGLGHAYLRSWFRALLWFWMWVLAVVLFVPTDTIAAEVGSFESLVTAMAELQPDAITALALVAVFNAADAYWQAARAGPTANDEGYRCPNCGKTLDEELHLSFCHWCTTPLPDAEEDVDDGRPTFR